jgi:hypothetical protein
MHNPKDSNGNPMGRLEQIIQELSRLYYEADMCIDRAIVDAERRMTPQDIRQRKPNGH